MSRSEDFRRTIRSGVRITRPTVVLQLTACPTTGFSSASWSSKAIGNAVIRNRVEAPAATSGCRANPDHPHGHRYRCPCTPPFGNGTGEFALDLPRGSRASAVGRLAERRRDEVAADRPPEGVPAGDQPAVRQRLPLLPELFGVRAARGRQCTARPRAAGWPPVGCCAAIRGRPVATTRYREPQNSTRRCGIRRCTRAHWGRRTGDDTVWCRNEV